MADGGGLTEAKEGGQGELLSAMRKELVSTGSPADAQVRRRYKAWDGGAGCTGLGGTLPEERERLTTPSGRTTASSLDAIKPGRHRRLQQSATAPGGSQTRAEGSTSRTPSSRGLGSARSKASLKQDGKGVRGMGGAER